MPPEELIVLGVAWYVVFLFTTVVHEGSHAVAARLLGDPTAALRGHATLDPRPHLRRSPMGMIVVPIASFLLNGGAWMIGWASVPYDAAWADRNHRRAALMSLAGPGANLLLALAAFLAMKVGLAAGVFEAPEQVDLRRLVAAAGDAPFRTALAGLASILLSLNLVLCVFNLLPVPPLDGSGVPPLFLSASAARAYHRFTWNPAYQVVGIVVAWNVFHRVWAPVFPLLLRLLHPAVGYQLR